MKKAIDKSEGDTILKRKGMKKIEKENERRKERNQRTSAIAIQGT